MTKLPRSFRTLDGCHNCRFATKAYVANAPGHRCMFGITLSLPAVSGGRVTLAEGEKVCAAFGELLYHAEQAAPVCDRYGTCDKWERESPENPNA